MDGIDEIAGRERLAIVGVAKNCGKTTTLNFLLHRRRELGLEPPALVSVGIDGESKDLLLGTEKPSIHVRRRQWIATAEGVIERGTAAVEYVAATGFSTPLGEVLICRVRDEGTILLAGLGHRRQVVTVTEKMVRLGAQAVWIDGAYGRVIGAHPDLSDAVIISTGAVIGSDVEMVAEKTRDLVSRLALPEVTRSGDRIAIEGAIEKGRPFIVDGEQGVQPLETTSALLDLEPLLERQNAALEAVAISGLVSDRVLESLISLGRGFRLLVPDGTVIHADEDLWRRFCESWKVLALRPGRVVGISYNPTSVTGRRLDGQLLKAAIENECSQSTAFNPLQ